MSSKRMVVKATDRWGERARLYGRRCPVKGSGAAVPRLRAAARAVRPRCRTPRAASPGRRMRSLTVDRPSSAKPGDAPSDVTVVGSEPSNPSEPSEFVRPVVSSRPWTPGRPLDRSAASDLAPVAAFVAAAVDAGVDTGEGLGSGHRIGFRERPETGSRSKNAASGVDSWETPSTARSGGFWRSPPPGRRRCPLHEPRLPQRAVLGEGEGRRSLRPHRPGTARLPRPLSTRWWRWRSRCMSSIVQPETAGPAVCGPTAAMQRRGIRR